MTRREIGDCILIHADCLEALPELAGLELDCMITDPPYGCTRNEWDKPFNLAEWWELVHAATKKNAAHCCFCQMPFSADLFLSNRKNFRYEYVYVKPKLSGYLNAKKAPLRKHEQILIFYRYFPAYEPQKQAGKPYVKNHNGISTNYGVHKDTGRKEYDGYRYPTSILDVKHDHCFYSGGKPKELPQHPTQKSVAALSVLTKTYTNSGETILDPFMGSGTTGVAAIQNGRKFIGIEKDAHWFDVACRRIEAAYQELALLREAANG